MTALERTPVSALPTISSETPKPYTGAVSMRLMPWSRAALIVATDWRSSVPPHIHPPMAQVPSATRDTLRDVAGMSTNSVSSSRSCDWIDDDMRWMLLCSDGAEVASRAFPRRFVEGVYRLRLKPSGACPAGQ